MLAEGKDTIVTEQIGLSDLEPLFVCQASGRRGADIRPDFDWDAQSKARRAGGRL